MRTKNSSLINPELRLYEAASEGNLELVKRLVSQGVDFDWRNVTKDGWTPLHVACYCGRTKVAEYLIKLGADVNNKSSSYNQSILHTVRHGDFETCKLLLDNGVDVNCRNKLGHNPLRSAVVFDHGKYLTAGYVKLLIEYDSNPFGGCLEGLTTTSSSNRDLVEMLQNVRSKWTMETHRFYSRVKRCKIESFLKIWHVNRSCISKLSSDILLTIIDKISKTY
jgi:hypothetical protein